jgi:hypothetical protein
MASPTDLALPHATDPAAPPKRLLRAAGLVTAAGLLLLGLGATAARNGADRLVTPEAFLFAWLVSLPLAAGLLLAYMAIGRRRLRRFERHAGFLPRSGRTQLPATGRRTLYRLEYGSHGERLCLMVTRWDYAASSGWRRGAVVEHVWLAADDAVAIGEQRARLTALAEELEERMDDARLGGEGERELADELVAESDRTRGLADSLARESR